MRDAMRWINRHWWAYGALVLVVDVLLLLVIVPHRSPGAAISSAVVYTVMSVWARFRILRRDRRAIGDDHADVERLGRMLRKGRTPEREPERRQMRGLVVRRRRQMRRLIWIWPAFNLMTLALGIAALSTGSYGPGLILVGVTLAMDVMMAVGWRRQRRNIERVGRAVGAF